MTVLKPGKLPVELLHRLLQNSAGVDDRVLLGPGIGRDSAAIAFGESVLVVKSDPITFPTTAPAVHLLHINANDIACQGGVPKWLLVTALLPAGSTTDASVEQLFSELQREAGKIGVAIIGGHTEITVGLDRPLLIGTMLGETTRTGLIDPTLASAGDRLLVTKTVGIEGTALLAAQLRDRLIDRGWSGFEIDKAADMLHSPGLSVVSEAVALASAQAVSALHDPTEGGIASAVREMAVAAQCGVVISREAIPVAASTSHLCSGLDIDPLGLLASGSLLAAVPKDRMEIAEQALQSINVPFAWIGKLTPLESGYRMRTGITEAELPEFGVDEVARILAG